MMARLRLVMMAKLSMLSRSAGISGAGARRQNPERSEGTTSIVPNERTPDCDGNHKIRNFLCCEITGRLDAPRGRLCGLRRQKLERETGFEPATSTLARSHSTTELLPLVLSFYCTCAFADNSLHPHCTPARLVRHDSQLGDVLLLSLACLRVDVVHRHVLAAVAQHALDDRRIGALFSQPSCKPMPQIMESETGHHFTIVITHPVPF